MKEKVALVFLVMGIFTGSIFFLSKFIFFLSICGELIGTIMGFNHTEKYTPGTRFVFFLFYTLGILLTILIFL